MAGSTYFTDFKFRSVGLQKVLADFQKTAAQIKSESAAIGKMNFTGMSSASPALKNIEKSLLQISKQTQALTASSNKAFSAMSSGAAKAASSTKAVDSSMKQLGATAGTTSTSVSRIKSSFTTLGTVGTSAFSKIISGARSAATAVGSISTSAGAATRSLGRMSLVSTSAGVAKGMATWTAPLAAGALSTYARPGDIAALAGGYGLYKSMQVEKYASEAAAKSWEAGMSKEDLDKIKDTVREVSLTGGGKSIFGADEKSQLLAEYAAMGGKVKNADEGLVTLLTNYAQAIGGELGTSTQDLISQNMMWYKGEDVFQKQNLQTTADMNAVLLAQTRLGAEDLMDLSKSGAPVANTYGLSQAEYLAAAGGLAQMGRSPEQASNDIRRILLRGTPSVTQQQKMEAYSAGVTDEKGNIIDPETGKKLALGQANEALAQLNMTWEDLNVEKSGGLANLMETIAEKMESSGMSELEQQAWMKTIYGIQGVTPTAMLAQGKDFITELEDKLERASEGEGAASTMAETQTDNLWGSTKKLMANLETSLTALGDKLNPSMKSIVDYMNENAVPALNKMGSAVLAGDWKGAAGVVGGAYDVVKEKGSEVFGDISSFLTDEGNWSEWGDILKGVIETVQDDLVSLTDSFADLFSGDNISKFTSSASAWITDVLSSIDGMDWSKIANNLIDTLSGVLVSIFESVDSIDFSALGTKIGNTLEDAAQWLLDKLVNLPWAEFTTTLVNSISNALKGVSSLVISIDWVQLVKDVGRAALMIVGAIGIGLADTDFAKYLTNSIANIYNKFVDLGSDIVGTFAYVGAEIGNTIVRGVKSAADRIYTFFSWIGEELGVISSGGAATGSTTGDLRDSGRPYYIDQDSGATISPERYEEYRAKHPKNTLTYHASFEESTGERISDKTGLEKVESVANILYKQYGLIPDEYIKTSTKNISSGEYSINAEDKFNGKDYYDTTDPATGSVYRHFKDGSFDMVVGGDLVGARQSHDTSGNLVSYNESGEVTSTTKVENNIKSVASTLGADILSGLKTWSEGKEVNPSAAQAEAAKLFQQVFPYWETDETADDDLDPAREELKKIEETGEDTAKNTEKMNSQLSDIVDSSKSAAQSAADTAKSTEDSANTNVAVTEAIATMNEGWKWATDSYKTRGATNDDGGWYGQSWEYIPYLEESGKGGQQIYTTIQSLLGKVIGLGSVSGYQGLPKATTQEMVDQALARVNISLRPSEGEIKRIQSFIESQGFSAEVLFKVDDSEVTTAKNEAMQPTRSYHTIYTNTVDRDSSKYQVAVSDKAKAKFLNIPQYAEGGYTGNYEGLAYLHPHETVIPDGKSKGSPVYISLDLRGAVITGDSAESFANRVVEVAREKFQSEIYR